jgi:hypothetical protein
LHGLDGKEHDRTDLHGSLAPHSVVMARLWRFFRLWERRVTSGVVGNNRMRRSP